VILFIFLIITVIVDKNTEEKGMIGVVWFIFVVIPWIGISFLVVYLIHRVDKIHLDLLKRALLQYWMRGMQRMKYYKSSQE
jgi:hypothetical protein